MSLRASSSTTGLALGRGGEENLYCIYTTIYCWFLHVLRPEASADFAELLWMFLAIVQVSRQHRECLFDHLCSCAFVVDVHVQVLLRDVAVQMPAV